MEHIVHKFLNKATVVTNGEFTFKGSDRWCPGFINMYLTHRVFDCDCEEYIKSWMKLNNIRCSWVDMASVDVFGPNMFYDLENGTRLQLHNVSKRSGVIKLEARVIVDEFTPDNIYSSDLTMAAVSFFNLKKMSKEEKNEGTD